MKVTAEFVSAGVEHYLHAASLPVDRWTRLLVRDVVCRIGPGRSWVIIRSRRFCHSLLYWRIKNHPIQLSYDIYSEGEWTSHAVVAAVG